MGNREAKAELKIHEDNLKLITIDFMESLILAQDERWRRA